MELNGYNDTAIFVKAITELWNCLNVNTKDGGILLNDKNREPFKSIEDEGLTRV